MEALLTQGCAGRSQPERATPQHQTLTALIFFHCLSSSALSFVSLNRRVLRPSDILIPYWKAALGKEGDSSVLGVDGMETFVPITSLYTTEPACCAGSSGWTGILTSNAKSKDPQFLLQPSQVVVLLYLSSPKPEFGSHCHPHPESFLSWIEPFTGAHSLGQSLLVVHVLAVLLLGIEVPAAQRPFLVTLQENRTKHKMLRTTPLLTPPRTSHAPHTPRQDLHLPSAPVQHTCAPSLDLALKSLSQSPKQDFLCGKRS